MIEHKKKEDPHKFDNNSYYKRYYTEILGEAAIEKYLNITGIIDWTIGNANYYHYSISFIFHSIIH